MSNNKKSSIDWFIDNLYLKDSLKWNEIIEQVKAMQKNEIMEAFKKGCDIGVDVGSNYDYHEGYNAKEYYNEIFGDESN